MSVHDLGNNRIKKHMKKWSKNRPCTKLRGYKGLVFHGTANRSEGADALATMEYFDKGVRYGSTQGIVDDVDELLTMNLDEVAWHVGARTYTQLGYELSEYGYGPNYFLQGIEICVNSDSSFSKAIINAIDLGTDIMIRFGYTMDDIYRHRDVTGKNCPDFFADDDEWNEFLEKLEYAFEKKKKFDHTALNIPHEHEDDWVEIRAKQLNIRRGPSISYDKIETSDPTYKLGETVKILETTNGWGKTEDGWISLNYTEEATSTIPEYDYSNDDEWVKIVNLDEGQYLNVRETPDTSKSPIGKLYPGDMVKVYKQVGRWYQTEEGYIHGHYCEMQTIRKDIVLEDTVEVYETQLMENVVMVLPAGTKVLTFGKNENIIKTSKGFIKAN